MNIFKTIFLIFFLLIFYKNTITKENFMLIQSTTSTRDSGFYEFILSEYKKLNDINIKVIASGTGHAINNAKKCDADIIIVHDKDSEDLFVRNGFGLYRKDLMYNDFILIGPNQLQNDFFGKNIYEALEKIYKKKYVFISRGDNSGTHKKELSLWNDLDLKVSSRKHFWFLETGSGMGSSLNVAVNKNAFILADKATWISFNNKKDHVVIIEGDKNLRNYYGIIPINPEKCPNSKIVHSEKFINWLLSKKGQELINSYKKNGEQLFFGNSKKKLN
tara:strand:- start:6 stop:830 length:825 start_codon:yes stop_codon:yes gene_type:complete